MLTSVAATQYIYNITTTLSFLQSAATFSTFRLQKDNNVFERQGFILHLVLTLSFSDDLPKSTLCL